MKLNIFVLNFILILFATIVTAVEVKINFIESAQTSGPNILIKEIASVNCEDKKLKIKIENIVVAKSAEPSYIKKLLVSKIKNYNLASIANVDEIKFNKVKKISVYTNYKIIKSFELIEKVKKSFFENSIWKKENVKLEFKHTPDNIKILDMPYTLVAKVKSNSKFKGNIRYKVFVMDGDKKIKTLIVPVKANVSHTIIKSARKIQKGSIIVKEDLIKNFEDITRNNTNIYTDAKELIGKRAKRTIAAKRVLSDRMIESLPLVIKGDKVTVTSVYGTASVSINALACEDGIKGDRIKVISEVNKKKLIVYVISKGFVSVNNRGI